MAVILLLWHPTKYETIIPVPDKIRNYYSGTRQNTKILFRYPTEYETIISVPDKTRNYYFGTRQNTKLNTVPKWHYASGI